MNPELIIILLTIGGVGVGVFAILISLLLSMREWRKEHREDIQRTDASVREWRKEHKEDIQKMDDGIKLMETKWDANLKAMDAKWDANLTLWDAKWERLITLFIEQGKRNN